jgi:ribonucleotide monophosphatase NagD (HAD superfamily)
MAESLTNRDTKKRAFSLILDIPVVSRGVKSICQNYDTFVLDQFGVMHDGTIAFEHALETVKYLKGRGKKLIVVSNSSSRMQPAVANLERLGYSSDLFDHVLTSGELTYDYLMQNFNGKKCALFAWSDKHSTFFEGLDVSISTPDEAEFLFFHGSQRLMTPEKGASCDMSTWFGSMSSQPLPMYHTGVIDDITKEVLEIGIKKGLTAVCANVDLSAVTSEGLKYMPGMFADLYESMGGKVVRFGKPDPYVFLKAIELAQGGSIAPDGGVDAPAGKRRPRVIHVGDSIIHDIKGAHAANIDSLLITSHGVHRDTFDLSKPTKNDAKTAKSSNRNVESPVSQPDGTRQDASASFDLSKPSLAAPEGRDVADSLLFRVCNECDSHKVGRPSYIMERLEL